MTYYNLTNATTSGSLVTIIQNINIASDYLLGLFILLSVMVTLFVIFKSYGIRTVAPIICFICTISSIYLYILALIPAFIMYIMIVATGASVIASIFINPE